METTHTPGPWRQGELLDTYHTLKMSNDDRDSARKTESIRVFSNFINSDQGRSRNLITVCELQANGIEETVANARLIAMAPDLLEALEEIVSVYCFGGLGGTSEDRANATKKARTVIAKAKNL